MADITLRVFVTVLTILVALGIGLLLRRAVVRRLKNTVLDNWLIQTLGIIAILPPLIVAVLALPIIITWNINTIVPLWYEIQLQLNIHDVPDLIRNLIATLLILVLGVGTARTLMRLMIRGLGENRLDINIRTLLGRIFYIVVLSFAIFWILSLWSVSIALPVTVIGVLTVAFTVAVQDILKDLVAGLYILMERPFHIGDQITTASYTGKVEDIQLRATKLRLVSGEEVIIPNSLVFGGTVVNNSQYTERRATITITLPQDEFDKDKTPELMLATIKAVDAVLVKPEPHVSVSGFTGSIAGYGYTGTFSGYTGKTVTLTARFWIGRGQVSTVTEVLYALRAAMPNADLVVRESAGDV